MLAAALLALAVAAAGEKPNFLIIHLDDVGYGDVSAYSSRLTNDQGELRGKTPEIDRMAKEGLMFTQYYSAACVCSPSRAGLLTGRYPVRTSIFPGVLTPETFDGLPQTETTLPSYIKQHAPEYYTFAVGKWHLGHVEPFLPINHGFEHWTGIPYSHDYCPCPSKLTNTGDNACRDFLPACPLMNGTKIWQQPAQLQDLTAYYARSSIEHMHNAMTENRPFFGYYACQHTHHPQFFNERFRGASKLLGGREDALGDALVEMDWAVGEMLQYIRSFSEANTFVFLTSDNGAAHAYAKNAGSNAPLRCGKGTTWEGGMRVPFLVWGGGVRKNEVSAELVAGMDLFPTVTKLAGLNSLPIDRVMDGMDFSSVLFDAQSQSPRNSFIYYSLDNGGTADAVRIGKYKVHFRTSLWLDINTKAYRKVASCRPAGIEIGVQPKNKPLVYDMDLDASEEFPLDVDTPEMRELIEKARSLVAADTCAILPDHVKRSKQQQLVASMRPETCDRSKQMHCLSGGLDPKPWPPFALGVEPFTVWEQPALQCCAADKDIVFKLDGTSMCIARTKGEECEAPSSFVPCNPSLVLFPECEGRAVCRNEDGTLRCSSKTAKGGGSGDCGEDSVRFCAQGYVQCQDNKRCVKSAKQCTQSNGLHFGSRLCGLCKETDVIPAYVPAEDDYYGEFGGQPTPHDARGPYKRANAIGIAVLVGAASLFAFLFAGLLLFQCKYYCFDRWCGGGTVEDVETRANLGEDKAELIEQ